MISNKYIVVGFLATTGLIYLLYYNSAQADFNKHKNVPEKNKNLHNKMQNAQNEEEVVTSTKMKNDEYPHNDLNDRNLTLIDIKNFKFLINNDICNVRRVSLVTIIHTAVENFEARSMIRWVT